MKEKIIKPGMIKKAFDLSRRRNVNCSIEAVEQILNAILDVIEHEVENGSTISLNGYMSIELRHRPQKTIYCASKRDRMNVPEQYKVHIKPGSKLTNAAKKYTEKILGEEI